MHLIALIAGPTLFWGAYHWYKDRHRPEPAGYLLLSYGLGIAGGVLASQGYHLLDQLGLRYDPFTLAHQNLSALLAYAVFGIGLIEELAKFLPFWLIGIRHHHFDEPIDGIIYASFGALGFASHENLYYLPWMVGWEGLGRGIASPLVHVMFASIWGYAVGRAHCRGRPVLPAAAAGLLLAALVHGVYDFFAIGLPEWAGIGAAGVIAAVWLWRMRLIRRLGRGGGEAAE